MHAKGFSVRRTLFALCAAYLAGIYFSGCVSISEPILHIISVLCVCAGVIRLHTRRSALFFLLGFMLIAGYCAAVRELSVYDRATQPGVSIEGVITRKTKDLRVMLSDVVVNGETALKRPVLVTLMVEEDENGELLEVREACIGQRVAGTGRLFEQEMVRNPGGVDRRIQAISEGYDLSGYILPGWTAEGNGRFSLHEACRQAKMHLSAQIGELFGESAPLYQAMLIGDRTHIEQELVQAMRLSGVAHLLTISGMHLTMIAHAVSWLLMRTPLGRRTSFVIKAMVVVGYTCLTGGAAGTVRACIMTLHKETALLCGRRYDPLTALAAAALCMTIVNPVWALSASFQFSFFVVLGIHLFYRQVSAAFRKCAGGLAAFRRIADLLAVSACAQTSAVPMQLMFYGYMPLLALPMNLLCSMLMPALMLGGWAALFLRWVLPPAGLAAAKVIRVGALAMEQLSTAVAGQGWALLRLPAPYAWTVGAFTLLLLGMSKQFSWRKGRKGFSFLMAIVIALAYLPRFDPAAQYVQLDVGQGDGAVLRKGRKAVLIDVGPEDEYAMLRYLRHEGLKVDAVVLSHLDEDHAGALGVLLDSEIQIGRIIMPTDAGEESASEAVRNALQKARDAGIQMEGVQQGDEILSDVCALTVLSPREEIEGSNERSLAVYTDLEGLRVLTLGDMPSKCEMEDVPACDVLKVSHHGSRHATSLNLIKSAEPEVAIISVGRNSYGHPHERVLTDLEACGAHVYRTDASGCVRVRVNSEGYSVKPFIR